MQRSVVDKTVKDILLLTLITISLSILIWLPFLLKVNSFFSLDFSAGFNTIYKNFDGLEYVVIAKTLYNPDLIAGIPYSLPANYYPAHFPGYSLLILLFAPLLGFLKSMLFTSLLFTIGSVIAFYFLVRDFKLSEYPFFLSIVFLVLPARWLIVHSVGSSEPIFIFFIITSLYFFLKFENTFKLQFILLAALMGLSAQLTRPPGILLFMALSLYILWKCFIREKFRNFNHNFSQSLRYIPLLLIPLGLVGIFYWFQVSTGNFFAYFHTGDNIHLTFPPYQVFNLHQFWVGDMWLEDLIYIFIMGFLGGMLLLKQKLYPLAFFVLTYTVASTLVVHRDISRYILPIFPFVLIAFEKLLTSKEFRIVLAIIILGIYLYSQNFIIENVAPIPAIELYN